MSNFKLIAIKTGPDGNSPRNFLDSSTTGVDIDYLKNLLPNTIYQFYQHFEFPENDFNHIVYKPEFEIDLYSLELSNGQKKTININAIVGCNGSGKSTLMELLYWINYNLGCKFGLLEAESGELYKINGQLNLQLLYGISPNKLHCLSFKSGEINRAQIDINENTGVFEGYCTKWEPITSIEDISGFFYSVIVNHSQFALNALEVGEWINPLFHKNDGYQTPIVLNPLRNNGNININRERELLSRRLQANVLENITGDAKNSLRNLGNNKIAEKLSISYKPIYLTKRNKEYGSENKVLIDNIVSSLESHFNVILNKRKDETERSSEDRIYYMYEDYLISYIYYKLLKIINVYPAYFRFKHEVSVLNESSALLLEIRNSDSHINYKVKGAILHLKYMNEIYHNSKLNFDNEFDIKIEHFNKVINKIKEKEAFFVNTYMMCLPSFFDVEILPANQLSVGTLSSGEKQRIFSLSSIVYHLTNLNSVEEQKIKYYEEQKSKNIETFITSYSYITIVLEEIELYYHPDWQRRFIDDILSYINKINPDNLKNIEGINIIFITHSPFILSDLPSQNILRLVEGSPIFYEKEEKTLGANIHELLKHNFFLNDGAMGAYAKQKIQSAIKFLDHTITPTKTMLVEKWDRNNLKTFIDSLGERLIRNSLTDLYYEAFFKSDEEIDQEIIKLEKKKRRVK